MNGHSQEYFDLVGDEYDPTTAIDLEELNYITTTETDEKEIPF